MNDPCNLRGLIADDERLNRFYRLMDAPSSLPGGVVTPHWMLDGMSFWYVENAPYNTAIFKVDGKTGTVAPLFDVQKTRKALITFLRRELPYKGLPFDTVTELGESRYRFSFAGHEYALCTENYSIEALKETLPAPKGYPRAMWLIAPMMVPEVPSPDGRWFASVQNGNIVLRSPVDDRTTPLTTDGTQAFLWDIEAPRPKGAGLQARQHSLDPWSPDGARLFAIKMDQRAVSTLPYIRYLKREEEVSTIKRQRAGGSMDISHPHVIDVLSGRARAFDLGDTENQFFVLIGWLPDGSEVLFTRHSRDFKAVHVLAGNPVDGSVRTVFSERAETFVAIQHEVIFNGDNHVALLPDGSGLIWRSSRSGWNHLYLYSIDGTSDRALTGGEYAVIDVVAIDLPGQWIYFTAHHDPGRPYDTHLCRVKISGTDVQRLTQLDGDNVVSVSPRAKTFTVINSRPDRPFRTDLYTCDGKHVSTIARIENPSAPPGVTAEEFVTTAADGQTPLWGVMYKPPNFNSKNRYPVVDHLYAGPQVAMVSRDFGLGETSHARLDRALAALGYIVVCVDARGTPERSKSFHDVVYRNWGRHEIPDHVATLQQLAQRHSFIDLSRVGVWGHSWGGYFTLRALMQAPDFFHVGVASAPATDPYDGILYEPYLDLPTRSKAAYDYATLYSGAGQIRGKAMLISGTADPCIFSNTVEMTHYLIQAGVDHELVVLPEAGHVFLGRNHDYFVHKLVGHFEKHLKSRLQ